MVLLVSLVFVQSARTADPEPIQAFVAPQYIPGSIRRAYYPGGEAGMARTARVLVSMMVDTEGKVFAPMIEQANNPRFIDSALKRVNDARYEPARLNGKPIESWQRFTARFNIDEDSDPRRVSTNSFKKYYKRFNTALGEAEPDQQALQELLRKMSNTRHGNAQIHEQLSYARYLYAEQYGNRDEQILALREMILSNDQGLARVREQAADIPLIQLLLESSLLIEALEAYQYAKYKYQSDDLTSITGLFEERMKEIRQMLAVEKEYQRPVKLNAEGYGFLTLVKRSVRLSDISGSVESFKIRCTQKFHQQEFASQLEVPAEWGTCQLQIIGTPETTMVLSQS